MKNSINTIFNNLSKFLLFTTLSLSILLYLVLQQNISHEKIENLKNQQSLIEGLLHLTKDDKELGIIQFNGDTTQLEIETNKLRNNYKYDYLAKYVLKNEKEYLLDLNKLSKLTATFIKLMHESYINEQLNDNNTNIELNKSFHTLHSFINTLMIKNIKYDDKKFKILEKFTIFTLLFVIFMTLMYRKKLSLIYKDILNLYAIREKEQPYQYYTQEADAIELKINKKTTHSDDPSFIDTLTQINNYKGMINLFTQKKNQKEKNFTSVTILEIDNFSKQNRTFNQSFTQTILKKVAFTISLHEQTTDIIARTDYNQFTIILSRESREQSFKDIDTIRQSISEIKLKEPNSDLVTITVSGGFIIKNKTQHIDDTINQAREILLNNKDSNNKIFKK